MSTPSNLNIRIRDEEFLTLKDFGNKIYLHPEESFALINTKKFLLVLKKSDLKLYEEVNRLRESETSKEVFLFKIQYLFAPILPLQYYGVRYENYEHIGRRIINGAPRIDIYMKDFLKYGLLSYYMKHVGDDKTHKDLYEEVLRLEHEFLINENRAYFKLGFYLDKRKEIIYRRRGYKDVKSFLEMILNPTMIVDFAKDFELNQYLQAYLEINNYQKELREFEAIVSSVEEWEDKK